jgi:photosystem II stability/assembly factor-like uncharacterized protein
MLWAVSLLNANTGIALGQGGTILRTDDAGTTWFAEISGTTNELHGIALVNGSTAIAVGWSGTILRTDTGGF